MASSSNANRDVSGPQVGTTPFPLVTVYVPSFGPCSKPRAAWLSLSSSVRWMYRDSEDDTPPDTFSAFRGHYCLALERLHDSAEWGDIASAVQAQEADRGVAITIKGKLSGRKRLAFMKNVVTLFIVTDNKDLAESWKHALRIRVAPWRTLRNRIKEDALDYRLSAAKLQALFCCMDNESDAKQRTESSHSGDGSRLLDREGAGPALDGIDTISNFVETVAVGLQMSAPAIQECAETIADMAKCVTVVGATFQVLALGMKIVGMLAERKRGEEELPRIVDALGVLQRAVVKSMVLILHPHAQLDEILVDTMFEVQEEHASILYEVEIQMMRGGLSQFIKAGDLKKIETSMEQLKDHVVNVVQSGKIAENTSTIVRHEEVIARNASAVVKHGSAIARHGSRMAKLDNRLARHQSATQRELENLKTGINAGDLAEMRERPRLTSYFVGREAEMDLLKEKLDEYGSAAIMQMGGAGKTQLMIAFAERAEKGDWIADGCCYWIPAFGNRSDFLKVLSDFAEALTERKVKDRNDASVVVGLINRKLRSLGQKWLLCIDNADDPDVNDLVGDLCGIVESEDTNGWVLVTSRQGSSSMWDGMVPGQKLKLAPLSNEQAKLVLLRWQMGRLKRKISDDEVRAAVERLQVEDPEEYKALSELAGSEKVHGLGGLPLGLAQAGSYISRNNDTFVKYVELYKQKRGDPKVVILFRKVGDSGLFTDQQRNVWTTWKLNVDSLSAKSRQVLQAYAFFDTNSVPEMLMKKLDPEFSSDTLMYREHVLEELVKGASLLDYEESDGKRVFKMHPLVREFVVFDLQLDDATLRNGLARAISAARSLICEALSGTECSVVDVPEHYAVELTINYYEVVRHSEKLLLFICDSPLSISKPLCSNHLVDVFRFSIRWNLSSEQLGIRFHRLMKSIYGTDADNGFIAAATHDLGLVKFESYEFVSAEQLFHQAIDMIHSLYGESSDNSEVAASFFQLGNISREQRNFAEAERFFRASLDMEQRLLGKASSTWSITEAMHCLGDVLVERGDMVGAERMFMKGYRMKRALGENIKSDLWLLKACWKLATGIKKTSIVSDPEALVRDWLDLARRARGSDYANKADVANLLRMLSVALLQSELLEETKVVFHECLEVYAGMKFEKNDDELWLRQDHRVAKRDVKFEERLRECLSICRQLYATGLDHLGYAAILHELGRECFRDEAEKWFLESLMMKRRLLGDEEDHPSISLTLHFLACSMKENDSLGDSEKYFRESLAMDERLYGDGVDHWNKALTMRELADVIRKSGNLESSKLMYHEYFAMVQRLPKGNLSTCDELKRLEGIADTAAESSAFGIAEACYRECLALKRKEMDEQDDENDYDVLRLAVLQRKLAQTLLRACKSDGAKLQLQECLNTFERMNYEKGDELYASSFRECLLLCQEILEVDFDHLGLARILFEIGREESDVGSSERYHRESLAMKRRILGGREDNASVSVSLFYLAKTLQRKGELVEAKFTYKESLSMDHRIHGECADHMDIATTLFELARVLAERGEVVEAERLFHQCSEMHHRLQSGDEYFGYNSFLNTHRFPSFLYLLANNALRKDVYSVAESASRKRIEMVRLSAHPFPFEVAVSLQKLAEILLQHGKLDESKSVFRESLDYYERAPLNTEKNSLDLFDSRDFRRKIDRGQVYRECIEIHRRLFREGYDHIGFSRILLGYGLTVTSDSDIDELCYRESISMQRRIFGDTVDHECISRTLFLLAGATRRKRALAQSIDLYQECLEMDRRLYDESLGHQNLTTTMSHMAWTLCECGKLQEAECMYRKWFEMETLMGTESTNELLVFLSALADRARKTAGLDGAERLCDEILEALQGLSTSADPYGFAVADLKVALLLSSSGELKHAEERLLHALCEFEHFSSWREEFFDEKVDEELVDICAAVFDEGFDHAGLANVLHWAGKHALKNDDCKVAELKLKLSLAMKRRLFGDGKGQESILQSLISLGRVMRRKSELKEAETLFRECLNMSRRPVGAETDCEDVLMSMHELSRVLGDKVELEEAELLMRKALEMGQRLKGGEIMKSDVAHGFYNLATSALKNGAFIDCERFCRSSLDAGRYWMEPLHLAAVSLVRAVSLVEAEKCSEGEKVFQEAMYYFGLIRHSDTKNATSHYEFREDDRMLIEEEGSYFRDTDFFEESFFFPECVKIHEKLRGRGTECMCLSRILHDRACREVDSDNLERAEKLFRDSLSMKRKILGQDKDDASISLTIFGLADVMKRRHLYTESESLYRESLRMDQRLQCERNGDLNVAITCNELAKVILKTGDVVDAERFYRESFEIKERVLLRDVWYWKALLNVGYYMLDAFAVDDAERLFRECLSETRRLHGGDVDRIDIADALYGLGRALFEKDELDDADVLFLESLSMYRRICGDTVDHAVISCAKFRLARIAFEKCRLGEAKELFNNTLEMDRRLIANKDDDVNECDVSQTLHWLARVAVEENDMALAEKLCKESVAAAWRMVEKDADDEDISNVLLVKARVALVKDTLDESVQLCHESMEMVKRVYGAAADRPEIAEALHILGEIGIKRGNVEDAVEYATRSLKMYQRVYRCNPAHRRIRKVKQDLSTWQDE